MKKIIIESIAYKRDDWWINARADIVIAMLSKYSSKNAKIIDIGAGSGLISEKIIKAGYCHVLAVDSSNTALSILKKKGIRSKKMLLPEVTIKKHYDTILLLDVLEHIEKDVLSLKRIAHKLKRKGRMIITVPAYKFLWSQKDDDYNHIRRYTKRELSRKIERAGLKINFISYFNFYLFLPAVFFARINKKSNRLSRYSSRRDRVFYPIFSFEKYTLSKHIKFPFGVSLLAVVEN